MKKIKRIGVEKKRIKPTEVRMSSLQQKLNQALSEGPTWDLEMEKFLRRATKKELVEKISKLKKDEILMMMKKFWNV